MTMRKKIVAGNWKMNTTVSEGKQLLQDIIKLLGGTSEPADEVIICPPFTHLYAFKPFLSDTKNIYLGAQNVHTEDSGAYTGEISAIMLKDIGVDYVIIGHSERRQYFKEDDILLRQKVEQALKHGLKVIFCVGETEDEYERNHSEHVVKRQVISALFTLEPDQFQNIIIAYEPVWAIGTGKTATPDYAQKMHSFIRGLVKQRYGEKIAEGTTILYGGSIKPSNAGALFQQPDVDGGLVGGASLDAQSFVEIVKQIS